MKKSSLTDIFKIATNVVQNKKKADPDLKELTSVVFERNPDIKKKRFLVEAEESLAANFQKVSSEEGISRNLLINLLMEYFLKNRERISKELKDLV